MGVIIHAQVDNLSETDSTNSQFMDSELQMLQLVERVDKDFNTYHSSISFTQEEKEKVKQLMLNKGKKILLINEDVELSENQKGQAIEILNQDCIDRVLKIKQYAKYREKSQQEVQRVDSVVSLSENQKLQLETIWHKYYLKVVKTYGDPSLDDQRRECRADLHRKIRLVLSNKQLSGYYKSISQDKARSRTKEQMALIVARVRYTDIQLTEIEGLLYQHNLEQEMIRERYRFKTEKKYAEIRSHNKKSASSIKNLLALTREDAVKQYVGNYQWE